MGEGQGADGLAIRWVDASLQAVTLRPGDTLVLTVPVSLSESSWANLRAMLNTDYPGYKVLILEDGLRLGVLATGEAEASGQR